MSVAVYKIKRTILIFFGVFLIAATAFLFTLYQLGTDFLILDDTVEEDSEADAIIVLSGSAERLERGAELYSKGASDTVILTNAEENGTTPDRAVSLGISEADILEDTKATSTYDNALYAKDIMEEQDLSSAIVVTSEFHSRRTKMTFDDIFGKDYTLSYAFTSSSFNSADGLTEMEKKTTFSEYTKMIFYSIRLLFD
ncbi:YdcF family protein [Halobacillus kuroshimensis]|uniref:YdcF family protein n=1 Tax=Halobacillus kuroshimensis TaxID=302481 RepID=A0ABS3DVD0_9BACI|nr:YdcF family protein [Halobacillus kuroshimensis]MBN8235303.1 YdcF family protein [Halobacillus kuroshimensis]